MKKKMVSVLLTASMLAGMTMFAVPVMAEDAAPENEVTGDASADDSFVVWGWNDDIKKILDGPFKEAYPDDYERIDLADLKVKSLDVEAWSPRQKKYFEVGSCSNLGDAQARRLKIRVNGKDGKKYLAHTLNNTVVAPPRMLIAFLENNLNADGSVNIPVALQPYMGGMTKIEKKSNK